MSKQQTGATKDRVESAQRAMVMAGYSHALAHNLVWPIADALVPPTHRIISVDDLRALRYFGEAGMFAGEDTALLERITALIGDEM